MISTIEFQGVGSMWPLYTKSDLMKRWGVTAQRVSNWESRHTDFPARVTGVMAGDLPVYGKADVMAYEAARGGREGVATFNAALGNRA